jgi:hypothetical protein
MPRIAAAVRARGWIAGDAADASWETPRVRNGMTRWTLALALVYGCASEPMVLAPDDAGLAPDVGRDLVDGPAVVDAPPPRDVRALVDTPSTLDLPAALDAPAPPDSHPPIDASPAPDIRSPADASPVVDIQSPTDASPVGDIQSPTDTSTALDVRPVVDVGFDVPPVTVCPTLPAPPPDGDPWSVTGLATAGAPTTRMVTTGGHRDLYLSGPSGVAEIAVRLDWGGTVVFFGQPNSPASNTIDANDTGRELQIALYDPQRQFQPCARDASCAGASPCGNSITYLGWDPVQGGDECNHGARVLRSGVEGDRMVVAVRPTQWNPDWDAADCRRSACPAAAVEVGVTYTLAFRFVHSNVVEVTMELASEEAISHAPTEQEFPTLYVGHGGASTDLPLLLDSAGTAITISTPANDGFVYANLRSAGSWVTWQHSARDYGVGLAMDHAGQDFQAWGGGAGAPYFHNVRPRQSFGLAAGGVVRGRAYLTLGSFDTVRSLMDLVSRQRAPFGAVDAPAANVTARASGGRFRVGGWALDNAALAAITVRVDGATAATLPRSAPRPDVCAVYPNYAGCPAAVGFDGEVTLPVRDGCAHAVEVVARDADGNETVLGRRLVVDG